MTAKIGYVTFLKGPSAANTEEGDNKVLFLTKVHIKYSMKIPQGMRAQAERALALHHARCPVSQLVERGIRVKWSAKITEV